MTLLALHRRAYGVRAHLAYVARFLRLRCSILYGCWPLVPDFQTALATHLQRRIDGARSASLRARAALAHRPVTTRTIRMPRAKFGPHPLKTVAMHKEQRNIQTDRFDFVCIRYTCQSHP